MLTEFYFKFSTLILTRSNVPENFLEIFRKYYLMLGSYMVYNYFHSNSLIFLGAC